MVKNVVAAVEQKLEFPEGVFDLDDFAGVHRGSSKADREKDVS